MTSDDTDIPTRALLSAKSNFGLHSTQLHIIKQGKVPCLSDGDASLALDPSTGVLLTKPHGHGDVHALLHSSGLTSKFRDDGVSHLIFLQDTNALVVGGVMPALGLSVTRRLAMNTISVPRKAGDASGALMSLTADGGKGRNLTVNVEYNQLDALVRGSGESSPLGGGGSGDTNDPVTGVSPYPGNTNQLIVDIVPYMEALNATHGLMPEFVNPKYTDKSKTSFKSPTRLECMMQV